MPKLAPLAAIPAVAVAGLLLASHLAMGNVSDHAAPAPAPAQTIVTATWSDPPAREASARPAPRIIPIVQTEPYRPGPVTIVARATPVEPSRVEQAPAPRKVEHAKPRHVARVQRRHPVAPAAQPSEQAVAQAPAPEQTRVASSGPLGDILKGLGIVD